MKLYNSTQIIALNKRFQQKCFDIVEKGVEDRIFLMKDVANCLGISKQVASKIVSPSNSRMLTAFELFRMSILTRRPIMDLISMDIYMTDDELKDTKLCEAVNGGYENTAEIRKLISYYKQLPEYIQHLVLMSLEALQEAKWE